MSIDSMAVLEKRVHQILEVVKRLRQDNAVLEQKIKTVTQRLTQQERDRIRWNQDRVRLRSRVERILSEMNGLPDAPDPTGRTAGKTGTRSRKGGGA